VCMYTHNKMREIKGWVGISLSEIIFLTFLCLTIGRLFLWAILLLSFQMKSYISFQLTKLRLLHMCSIPLCARCCNL